MGNRWCPQIDRESGLRCWAASWRGGLLISVMGALCGVLLATMLWGRVERLARSLKSHPYFTLQMVEVTGNRRLNREEVLQWAGLREGSSIWDASPATVQLRLQSHPWVLYATAQRDFPCRLLIRIAERVPVAIVRFDELDYVDRDGHVLGPLRPDDNRDLPLITGLEGPDPHGFTAIALHRALQLLRWCARGSCLGTISEVHLDRQRGLTVFPLRTAVAVVLGWGSWHEKLARAARVFAALEGQAGRLVAVDVSFRDLVVVKLQEERHLPAVRNPRKGARV
jgi:cell division protein FtsQ